MTVELGFSHRYQSGHVAPNRKTGLAIRTKASLSAYRWLSKSSLPIAGQNKINGQNYQKRGEDWLISNTVFVDRVSFLRRFCFSETGVDHEVIDQLECTGR